MRNFRVDGNESDAYRLDDRRDAARVATYAGVAGRLHRFRINVFDESGLIGSAEHTRAVMNERECQTARRRADQANTLTLV